MFLSEKEILSGTWQSFERVICRLLICEEYSGVRIVGQSGDHGADIIASKLGKRWLFQAKHWKNKVGTAVVDETLRALSEYHAQIPVIVALNGFDENAKQYQMLLHSRGIPLQLWDLGELSKRGQRLPGCVPNKHLPRPYQEGAINNILEAYFDTYENKALIVMATGLGKTFISAEGAKRIYNNKRSKFLVLAHTNPLVYQLERSFWPFLLPTQRTVIWNGYEKPSDTNIESADMVFACINTIADHIRQGNELPCFDVVIIDECHHAGSNMYADTIEYLGAGKLEGSFLMGMTATPWRPDEVDITTLFGHPRVQIDIVEGLKKGFLSNVDYRMHTDNIDWSALRNINGKSFTAKQINRTLFINQWDDAVVLEFQKIWSEQKAPRAIVFCGTIDHAITMRDKINSLGFCNAAAIYSQSNTGLSINQFERNRILSDFSDGIIDVICAVDVFNEGIDVPDVNILVFQRVTHSRRIFIQQLGRGLRISEGKEKVIVLDFVSDIRRFAAGIDLKNQLEEGMSIRCQTTRIDLPNKVTFKRVDGEDPGAETFLREWLDDVVSIENAGEDASVLKFPPAFPGGRQ
ncbi:MAG: putative DNA repair helicase RadD [Candidatus Dichloromethanomonas elyunquensis]|nr:MAG: putative DNA repair helicase RadD [Candidatus Dichloromethanomonas elyunquensis]